MRIDSALGLPLVLLSLTACGKSSTKAGHKPPPNGPARRVVLVTCDTLRADHLSCYGYARPTTPNIDRLATESTLYLNAWSVAPMTMPSISSLLTGFLPDEIGTHSNQDSMPASVHTMAEIVRESGFDTAAFVSNSVLCRVSASQDDVGVQQGFAHFDDELMPIAYAQAAPERTGEETTRAVVRWLDQRRAEEDRFFLWVHYMDPHGPYVPSAAHLALFARDHAGEAELPLSKDQSGLRAIPAYQALEGVRKPGEYIDRYDAEIHQFDAEFEHLIEALSRRGWLEDTLLVFTADHGESLGEHDSWFCHGDTLQPELVHVPLLVRPPRSLRSELLPATGGRRNARLALHLDVCPTIFAALGIEGHARRGLSLLQAQLPGDRVAPQYLGSPEMPRRRIAVTDGRWRSMARGVALPVLYDLAADPNETTDVTSVYPAIAASLKERYTQFAQRGSLDAVEVTRRLTNERPRHERGAMGYAEGTNGDQ